MLVVPRIDEGLQELIFLLHRICRGYHGWNCLRRFCWAGGVDLFPVFLRLQRSGYCSVQAPRLLVTLELQMPVAVEEQLWVQPQLAVRVVAQLARAEQPLVVAVEEQLWVQPQLVALVAPAHRF